VYTVYDA
jgi:hypothetical protein